jgi:acetylornithine deacetylase/succinyl-diaminopimelate desuccinylase-like protein
VPQDGRLPEPLQVGVRAPTDAELQEWASLPAGVALLESQGAAPADRLAAEEFYLRTWALPSLDVNGIEGGSPVLQKTIVTASARANLSMRLASGQTVDQLVPILERLLRQDLPDAAELTVEVVASCDPGHVARDSHPIALARDAFERATGRRPLLLRSGGSLPIVPLLERLGIPAVVTGFDVPSGNIHAPNERMLLTNLALAVAAARETFLAFADL